ncbi:MAG: DUF502 domain-containing protein [Burkholderiaceae bacterium]|nr:MAG: DUF502 domain-containing protein [Burkholderiaceae bacterium]
MKKYLLTGLLIWVPIVVTLWVLSLVVGTMDQTLTLLPAAWQPDNLLGFHVPGLGVILSVVVVLLTGMLTANILGRQLLKAGHGLVTRIPVVRSIYSSVKQVSDTLLSESGQAFHKAVLIEYPRKGTWTIAFLTGVPGGDAASHLPPGEYVSVYVPTTPNPTSGFFLMLPRADVTELNMSVDGALKYIISMGVVAPSDEVETNNE